LPHPVGLQISGDALGVQPQAVA